VHKATHPVHVTLRVREGIPNLRHDKLLFVGIRAAIALGRKPDFRVIHFSVQSNHLHLIVEAHDERALSMGMQSLGHRMAHAVHRAMGVGGRVFADRYHAHALRSPREVRAALVYVLQNWAKHGEGGRFDPRSSALWFDGWKEPPPGDVDPPIVSQPRTWLVKSGWRRHGLIKRYERPGRLVGATCA
jgi:REP element-mobilizing transposase RayT